MKPSDYVLVFCVCGILIGYILLLSSNFSTDFTSSKDFILANIQSLIKVKPPLTTFNIKFVVSNTTTIPALLENFCETEQCVEQFHPYNGTSNLYVPQYNLANCAIPKSLSTIIGTILCFISDPEDFKKRSLTMTEGAFNDRVCKRPGRKHSRTTPNIDRLTSKDWTHMVVVRNPIDRLISGFVDKCIAHKERKISRLKSKMKSNLDEALREIDTEWCLGCGENLTCFVHKNYEKLLNIDNDMSKFPLQNHFFPQTWFCIFSKYVEYYTILRFPSEKNYMNNFYEAIGNVLQSQQVPQNLIDKIIGQISTQKTDHATSGTDLAKFYKNWLYGDKELLKIVVKTYFYDFITFGFEFPQL